MRIYVMRHGTTIWNEKGITQGRTNNRLSKTGKELTEQASLKHKNTDFDVIYSSPLMRTIQTANIMNKYHNVKIIKDDRLIEIDQGIFSGRNKNDISPEEMKFKLSRSASCGMESYESVYERVCLFMEDIKQNRKHNNILIVTHNVNASFLHDILSNISINYNKDEHLRNFKNAEIKVYEI